MTYNDLIESFPYPELAKDVVENLGGWEEFGENADSIRTHGIDGGYCRFVYYSDTVAFFDRNYEDILQLLSTFCDDTYTPLFKLLHGFRCFRGYSDQDLAEGLYVSDSETATVVRNGLAWFAAEEVCKYYMTMLDDEEYERKSGS